MYLFLPLSKFLPFSKKLSKSSFCCHLQCLRTAISWVVFCFTHHWLWHSHRYNWTFLKFEYDLGFDYEYRYKMSTEYLSSFSTSYFKNIIKTFPLGKMILIWKILWTCKRKRFFTNIYKIEWTKILFFRENISLIRAWFLK